MNRDQAKEMASELNSHVVYERSIEAAQGDALLDTAYDSLNSLVCRGGSFGIYTEEQRKVLREAFDAVQELQGQQENWRNALRDRFSETQG